MEVVKKQLSNKLLLVFLFCIGIVVLGSRVSASSDYGISNYTMDATIQENGDLHVEEYVTYEFESDMQGLYRNILYNYAYRNQKDTMEATSSRYQASDVENVSVYTSDHGFDDLVESTLKPDTLIAKGSDHFYSVTSQTSDGYRKQVKAYSPVKAGDKKYIKYTYDIKDVAVKYDDKGEYYWNFIGKDWDVDLHQVTIRLHFPESISVQEVIVSPHSYAKIEAPKIEGNSISIYAPVVSQGTAVDARVVFDGSILTGNVKKTIAAPYDMQEHDKIENKMVKDASRYHLSNQLYVVIAVIAIAGFAWIMITVQRFTKRRKPSKRSVDYETQIPEGISLVDNNCIKNGVNSYGNPNLLNATILDLTQRKYIIMNAQKKVKKSIWDNIEYNYFMKLDEKKDYSQLNDYEWMVLNLLFNEYYAQKKPSIVKDRTQFKEQEIELNEVFKKIGKNYSAISAFQSLIRKEGKKQVEKFYDNISPKAYHVTHFVVALVVILLAINVLLINPMIMDAKMEYIVTCTILAFVYSFVCYMMVAGNAKILKEEYVESYKKLLGLEKYLNDYSMIKDRFPIELALWDQYLVFASLFGIAEKVSKEFKKDLAMQGYDDDYIFIHYPILNMAIYSESLNTVMSTSTGTASSGGYSGGGSGGGGRRRWRWWCFLAPPYHL